MISFSRLMSLWAKFAGFVVRLLSAPASSIGSWFTIHRLYHGWIVVAILSAFGIFLGTIFGVGWMNVVHGFLLGFAIGNIGLVQQLIQKRALLDHHQQEIRALMAMNSGEIARAIADLNDDAPTAPRLQ